MHYIYPLYIKKNQWIAIYIPASLLQKKINRYHGVHITNINYADDIAVITNSLIDANKLLNKFEDTAEDIGLHIYSDKTEYMCLNHENQINMKSLSSHDITRVL